MGEVYKARDIRLDRFVAIKVLPSEVASDPERLRRFEQEARAASALNHPNILTIYDVGSADSISYIAMELVEGKTLRDLLLKGPLSVKKLLDLAVQIAEGLASAHEAGIVHRDLKPSNIVISKDGFAKILDFGLAKLPTPAPKLTSSDSDSTTAAVSETQPGAIVGTVDYMSPEQAAGKEADYRSDQFAFGSILYEMATGKRAFRKETTADTLVAILRSDPEPVRTLRPELPVPARWLIGRCLAKTPTDRFASTRDLAGNLQELRENLSEVDSPDAATTSRASFPWVNRRSLILLLGVSAIVAMVLALRHGPRPPTKPVRFAILPPEGGSYNFESTAPAPVAISADGRKVVYGARDRNGTELLWVRFLEDLEAKPVPGTEGATYPFWSPDGEFIGFFSERKLKKTASAGGPIQILADARSGRGGSWSKDGVILFAPDSQGPLYRVSASGGASEPVTQIRKPAAGETHRWPSFLPDGRHFLYTMNDQGKSLPEGGIYLGDLGKKDFKRLLAETSNAAYAHPGYILFGRDGALFALPFDANHFVSTSPPLPVADRVNCQPYRWNCVFAASQTGALAYVAGPSISKSELVWLDRSGRRLSIVGGPADYGGLRLSPSADRCAVEIRDPRSGAIDVWVLDLVRESMARLTSGARINDCPTWSPDGKRIIFSSHRSIGWDLYERGVASTTSEQLILASEDTKTPTDWSPDGRYLALTITATGKPESELWVYSFDDRKLLPYLRATFAVAKGRFSPDGRWMAYVADETGRAEVYVSPSPSADRRWQISAGGGSQPVWSHDGDLFFVAPDRKLITARIATDPEFRASVEPLFAITEKTSPSDIPLYDVSRDGNRFLVNTPTQERISEPLTIVLGWNSRLYR